ncbi:MAG: hypothetical protein NC348_12940 [Clostridium sp.]|nr:hypothetical protein [Clostridium sp.]
MSTKAIAAAATGFAALETAAVKAYSDYEQLAGGVETLFDKSADKVMEYANKAYKTAGLSANAYMETVTSFSASLLQSLDGDTAAAADKADKAIVDMSDNANKMGSSMESIQNAYQGFAKQNYTMLDNLKLGYGGTKEEMERLLSDAREIAGVEFDISSYADVVDAIHVVQENMGITGTTSKEAATTIQGSISSFSAAWENFLTGMADEEQDFDQLLSNLVDSALTVVDNLAPRIIDTAPRLAEGLAELVASIGDSIPDLLSQLLPIAISAVTNLLDSLCGTLPELIATVAPQLISAAFQLVSSIANAIIQNLPLVVSTGLQLIIELANGIVESLPELIPTIVEVILQIVETLIDNVDALVEAAIQIILALANGIINALPILIEKAPVIIEKLLFAIIRNAPQIVKGAIELITKLAEGIVKNIPILLKQIPALITTIVQGFIGALGAIVKIGVYIVQGIWDGITSAKDWLIGKVKDFGKNIIDAAKSALGIHSPSKEFAYIGKMCLEGFDQEFDEFDPYNTLNASMKANKSTLTMSYNAGLEIQYGTRGIIDYDKMAETQISAWEHSGITVEIDGKPAGRVLRSFLYNSSIGNSKKEG